MGQTPTNWVGSGWVKWHFPRWMQLCLGRVDPHHVRIGFSFQNRVRYRLNFKQTVGNSNFSLTLELFSFIPPIYNEVYEYMVFLESEKVICS